MRFDAIETITPLDLSQRSTIVLHQSSSRLAALAHVLVLLPSCLVMLAPFALVAAYAAEQPGALTALSERPIAAAQIAVGFACVAALLAFTISRLAQRLGRSTRVEIDAETVRVVARSPLMIRRWQAPLAGFAGITHNVRATLNGTRQELVLVHPEPDRSILLEMAPRLGEARIAEVCRHFGLPHLIGGRARQAPEPDHRPPLQTIAA
jgi:hypothetical protein